MKQTGVLVILWVVISCHISNSRIKETRFNAKEKVDTLSFLPLLGESFKDSTCLVLHLCNLDTNGNRIDSTKRIELTRNCNVISWFSLPNSEDVKNFSVTRLAETSNGISLEANWGGGNHFYELVFYFVFRNRQFYFDSLPRRTIIQTPESETLELVKPSSPVPVSNFKLIDYL